jgi:hypothetical protein
LVVYQNETQRTLKSVVWRFIRLCAGKTLLPFPVTDMNSLFVGAMRSVWFASYTNANNCWGEKRGIDFSRFVS